MPAPIFEPPVAARRAPVRMSAREVRDLLGLVLVVLGCLGLVLAAWLWHPLAGLAATSVAFIVAGIALGYDW